MAGHKAALGQLSLDVRKRFLTERVVGHWNRIPRKVVTAQCFKVHLVDMFSHIV